MRTDLTDDEHGCLDLLRDLVGMKTFRPHPDMITNLVERGLVHLTSDDWAGLTDDGKLLLRIYGEPNAY